LKKEIENKYSGYDKAHRMMLLDGGLKFTPTSPTHKDILFPEVRGLDKERILQIFGMKKAILSIDQDSNRAIAWQQEKSWWTATNIPIMKMITSAMNFTYFEAQQFEVRFDTSAIEALQAGFQDKVKTAKQLVEIGFTPNEVNARLQLGFDDAPWRDYIFKSKNERAIGPDAPAVQEEPEPLVIEDEPLLELPAPGKEEEDAIIYIPKESFNSRGERFWKSMVARAKPIEKKFLSKTKRMFFEWRKLCLDWLYSQQDKAEEPFRLNKPLRDIDKMGLTPFKRLKKEADIMYEQTLMAGLESIMIEIGEALDIDLLALADAQTFLELKSMELKGLVDTQAKLLRKSLTQGMEKGESMEQLANRIRRKFDSAAKRALTIARTEVYGALNYGRWETVKQTDYTKVQWFTSLDEKVRTTHKRMHGKTKKIKEKWIVGGSKLRFPGDPASGNAGEVINCRCIEVVVLDK
jgi:SPP1 gp7 family putative phage head morphogenesis protein